MYVGKTEDHPSYNNYNIRTKTSLIRYIYNCIESIKKKDKIIKEISLENNYTLHNLENNIEHLQEFIIIQKQEIDELLCYKRKAVSKINRKTYLMKDNHNGLYKIGFSKNPEFRESTLQSEKPSIKTVKTWDKDIEKHLHKTYSNNRVRGEWFDLTKLQVKYICTHF